MDARFENTKNPKLERAVVTVDRDETSFPNDKHEFYYLSDGIPKQLTDEEYEAKFPAPPAERRIYDQKEFEPIELPPLSELKVKKKYSPLNDLQKYFVDKFGKEKAQEIYRRLYVSKEYYEGIEEKVRKVVKKTYPGLHPVKIDQSVAWEMLDMSPLSFEDTPEWADKNMGYTRKKVERD
jgi:hypothetical protein